MIWIALIIGIGIGLGVVPSYRYIRARYTKGKKPEDLPQVIAAFLPPQPLYLGADMSKAKESYYKGTQGEVNPSGNIEVKNTDKGREFWVSGVLRGTKK